MSTAFEKFMMAAREGRFIFANELKGMLNAELGAGYGKFSSSLSELARKGNLEGVDLLLSLPAHQNGANKAPFFAAVYAAALEAALGAQTGTLGCLLKAYKTLEQDERVRAYIKKEYLQPLPQQALSRVFSAVVKDRISPSVSRLDLPQVVRLLEENGACIMTARGGVDNHLGDLQRQLEQGKQRYAEFKNELGKK